MSNLLLSISPQDGAFAVDDQRAKTWLRELESRLSIRSNDDLTRIKTPFEATVLLAGEPEENEVLPAIAAAFRAIEIVTGTFDVAISEHRDDDAELETPPYFEETLDLAQADKISRYPSVSLELEAAAPIDDATFAELDKAVRSTFSEPIEFFGRIMRMEHKARLAFAPMPPDQVPSPEDLRVRAFTAADRAGLALERLEVGAFIGDWDTTLFANTYKSAKD